MAAIASVNARQQGAFVAAPATLTSSDTITFDPTKKQLAVFRNGTGGALTAKIDGNGGTNVQAPGLPPVDVSGGYDIALAAGETKAVVLSSIAAYCQGVVTITGAVGASLTVFDL